MSVSLPYPLENETQEPRDNELWAIRYGSSTYNQVNWWSGFMLSQYIDQKALRAGTPYLLGTQKHLPNRWTLIFTVGEQPKSALTGIKNCWQELGKPRLRLSAQDAELLKLAEAEFRGDISPRRFNLEREL